MMLQSTNYVAIGILILLCILLTILVNYLLNKKRKKQLDAIFIIIMGLLLFWMLGAIIQIIAVNKFNANPLYIDYFVYIPICFMPVSFFFMAMIFSRTKIKFKKIYYLLFIIPILSLIMLWTNDLHHLFYKEYSTDLSTIIMGNYFYIHEYYGFLLYAISLFILIKYSIKNSGFFSKQASLILIGSAVPIVINILGLFKVINMSVYITPISFALSAICFVLATSKFNFLKVTPIALQTIVDRISDSYVVLNESYEITDFNETLIKTFHLKKSIELRGSKFENFLADNNIDTKKFSDNIAKVLNNDKTAHFEIYIKKIEKFFNIEITSITVNSEFLGILVLFKDITQHVKDMQSLKDNQSMLMEQERLASLGQMIGGVAHNLKTPIMSISGAAEGLKDLVNEYDASIGNPIVTNDDFHDIAKDMREWLEKINSYTEYMSDILTAVKGQAVTLTEQKDMDFTIGELFKRVNILMKHELKQAVIYLNMGMKVDENLVINGDVNSLVQVINNMISNAIQAYDGKQGEQIDLVAWKNDNNNIVISVKDYGPGLPEKVQKKLFKEMITTKGKNGTGLGLYMSYSNIKAHFGGDITVETETGKGTTFNITLPCEYWPCDYIPVF